MRIVLKVIIGKIYVINICNKIYVIRFNYRQKMKL